VAGAHETVGKVQMWGVERRAGLLVVVGCRWLCGMLFQVDSSHSVLCAGGFKVYCMCGCFPVGRPPGATSRGEREASGEGNAYQTRPRGLDSRTGQGSAVW
jgi:hypothetical protein